MLKVKFNCFFWLFLLIVSCEKETVLKEPVIFTLSSDSGFIGSQLIITGSNFGSDKNKISVSFDQIEGKVDSVAVNKLFIRIPEKLTVGAKLISVSLVDKRSNPAIFNILKSYQVSTVAGSGLFGTKDGNGLQASFSQPEELTMDKKGNLFIADNFVIRKIDINGNVSLYAGSSTYGHGDGATGIAKFNQRISGISMDDADNLYVADYRFIRKVDLNGNVTTLCGAMNASIFSALLGITLVDNSLFVVDIGQIKSVDLSGTIKVFTGDGSFSSVDGPTESAKVIPFKITTDNQKNLIFTEFSLGSKIRRSTTSNVSTLISKESLKLNGGLTIDREGNIYTVNGDTIIKIDNQGQIELVSGSVAGYQDGFGNEAKFFKPTGLFVDGSNNIYVCDTFNNRIRKIAPIN
jgi:hypothetical protein